MRIGVDLGGTKIECLLLDDSGRELACRRIDCPRGNYEGTLRVVSELVTQIEREFAVSATVGVAIPGTISPDTGLVKNANSVWLIGHPLQRDLSDRLNRPVRIANDADCFAISEATDGAGAGLRSVFGVILGTGVGAGICWRGVLISGPNAIAGEWGHNPLPWPDDDERPGPECYCGLKGCIETFLSGPSLRREFQEATGQDASPQDINARAGAGDALAEQTLRRYEGRLARALALVINILDPHVIVLGGGLSNLGRLYTNVPALWTRWVFSGSVLTRLLPPTHGDSSGVRGAAWLWPLARATSEEYPT